MGNVRIGLCGIGLEAYWPQFSGLRARLDRNLQEIHQRLDRPGIEVIPLGMVDHAEASRSAGDQCRRSCIDLLVIYIATYAVSSSVLPMVQRAKVPVIILNLQPEASIEYARFNKLSSRTEMTEEWLAYCSSCPAPELSNVFKRAQIPFHQVTGILDDSETWAEMDEWVAASTAQKALANARLGLMGHYYNGMLDIVTDLTQISITFGTHIEQMELGQLSVIRENLGEAEVAARCDDFFEYFEITSDCPPEEITAAARTSVALERFLAKHNIDCFAYYVKGVGVPQNEETVRSIIPGASMLTAKGIPVAGEYEVKNALAMKIMETLGAGGSFSEYYALDFKLGHVLMGHDGPGHPLMAESKTKLRPLNEYHGKVGSGLSVEMSVKQGPVTFLSIAEDRENGFKFVIAEGESVPGEVLHIGNTNSHYKFPIGVRPFVEAWNAQGPAHHCAIGVGHVGRKLTKLAKLIGIPVAQVC